MSDRSLLLLKSRTYNSLGSDRYSKPSRYDYKPPSRLSALGSTSSYSSDRPSSSLGRMYSMPSYERLNRLDSSSSFSSYSKPTSSLTRQNSYRDLSTMNILDYASSSQRNPSLQRLKESSWRRSEFGSSSNLASSPSARASPAREMSVPRELPQASSRLMNKVYAATGASGGRESVDRSFDMDRSVRASTPVAQIATEPVANQSPTMQKRDLLMGSFNKATNRATPPRALPPRSLRTTPILPPRTYTPLRTSYRPSADYRPMIRERPVLSSIKSSIASRQSIKSRRDDANESPLPEKEENSEITRFRNIKFRERSTGQSIRERRSSITWDLPGNEPVVATPRVATVCEEETQSSFVPRHSRPPSVEERQQLRSRPSSAKEIVEPVAVAIPKQAEKVDVPVEVASEEDATPWRRKRSSIIAVNDDQLASLCISSETPSTKHESVREAVKPESQPQEALIDKLALNTSTPETCAARPEECAVRQKDEALVTKGTKELADEKEAADKSEAKPKKKRSPKSRVEETTLVAGGPSQAATLPTPLSAKVSEKEVTSSAAAVDIASAAPASNAVETTSALPITPEPACRPETLETKTTTAPTNAATVAAKAPSAPTHTDVMPSEKPSSVAEVIAMTPDTNTSPPTKANQEITKVSLEKGVTSSPPSTPKIPKKVSTSEAPVAVVKTPLSPKSPKAKLFSSKLIDPSPEASVLEPCNNKVDDIQPALTPHPLATDKPDTTHKKGLQIEKPPASLPEKCAPTSVTEIASAPPPLKSSPPETQKAAAQAEAGVVQSPTKKSPTSSANSPSAAQKTTRFWPKGLSTDVEPPKTSAVDDKSPPAPKPILPKTPLSTPASSPTSKNAPVGFKPHASPVATLPTVSKAEEIQVSKVRPQVASPLVKCATKDTLQEQVQRPSDGLKDKFEEHPPVQSSDKKIVPLAALSKTSTTKIEAVPETRSATSKRPDNIHVKQDVSEPKSGADDEDTHVVVTLPSPRSKAAPVSITALVTLPVSSKSPLTSPISTVAPDLVLKLSPVASSANKSQEPVVKKLPPSPLKHFGNNAALPKNIFADAKTVSLPNSPLSKSPASTPVSKVAPTSLKSLGATGASTAKPISKAVPKEPAVPHTVSPLSSAIAAPTAPLVEATEKTAKINDLPTETGQVVDLGAANKPEASAILAERVAQEISASSSTIAAESASSKPPVPPVPQQPAAAASQESARAKSSASDGLEKAEDAKTKVATTSSEKKLKKKKSDSNSGEEGVKVKKIKKKSKDATKEDDGVTSKVSPTKAKRRASQPKIEASVAAALPEPSESEPILIENNKPSLTVDESRSAKTLVEKPLEKLPRRQLSIRDDAESTPPQVLPKSRNNQTTERRSEEPKVRKRIRFRKYCLADFNVLNVLGRGSFGKVFLAELKEHQAFFAIKCMKKHTVIEDDDVESTMIERRVLALGCVHPFICKLFCTFQTESHLCFVMEYLCGGDLMFHIQKYGKMSEDWARFYAAEVICALKFLHKKSIIYRDLKLDNIVLDAVGHIRLVDFGMCQCKIYREDCLPSNFCGTPEYMAPEIIKGVKYNHLVDWWSFGVLLYEMIVGRSPFTGSDEDELLWNVCYEKVNYPKYLSRDCVAILALLLEKDPEKRLMAPESSDGDVAYQPFFSNVKWDLVEQMKVSPPYRPDVEGALDLSNFDKEFTEASPKLTPIDEALNVKVDHELFKGFSYTNPNMTD